MSRKAIALVTAGGKITCMRCSATSKRTRLQCGAPAITGKVVCRFHGGHSTGPRSADGKARIVKSHRTHGDCTRAKRKRHREVMQEIKFYASLLGISWQGKRIRGARSNNY